MTTSALVATTVIRPAGAASFLDREGFWAVGVDGTHATFLPWTSVQPMWSPDGVAVYGPDGRRGLIRYGLDGSVRTFPMPPVERPDGSGTEGRELMSVSIGGDRAGVEWVDTDDHFSGSGIAPLDLSTIVAFDHVGRVSVSPDGHLAVVANYEGAWVYDSNGHLLGGPFAADDPWFPLGWSSDNHHVLIAGMHGTSCVLDTTTGQCDPTPLDGGEAQEAGLLSDGLRLVASVLPSGASDDLLQVGPYGGPLRTIVEHERFAVTGPADKIAYTDFEYPPVARPNHVHLVDSDGGSDHVIAFTPAGWTAKTFPFSPDGQTVLVQIWTPEDTPR